MKMKLSQLPAFERGFFTAAFWTADDNAPGGMDYRDTGNAEELFERLHPVNKKNLLYALHDWKLANLDLLNEAGDDEQNGHDLWLTQSGHGCGFWDRGYGELGDELSEAARLFGPYECSIDSEGVFIE